VRSNALNKTVADINVVTVGNPLQHKHPPCAGSFQHRLGNLQQEPGASWAASISKHDRGG
jgi:hypothetical protein